MIVSELCKMFCKLCKAQRAIRTDIYCVKMYSQIKLIKMKNLTLSVIAIILLFQFSPVQLNAATTANLIPVTEVPSLESPKSSALLLRLNELKAMDRSEMSFSEKRQVRREARSIKKELKQLNGGVYLSAGAIIIIVLLLILIL